MLTGCLTAGDLLAQNLQAESGRCADTVEARLAELPLAPGDVKSVRIVEKVNLDDEFGPEILGVEGWVRLNSCSGWLVVNMRASCYILETYTRGDCRVEGLSNY
ncbi:MAG TPA: hypothetical protein VKP12_11695 [Kiloniellaceae bacterium]|nr:hypothetical protein [Kiloniellaceae bacterium]